MPFINNVNIDTTADIHVSVDQIHETLDDDEKRELVGLLLYNDLEVIEGEVKSWLEDAAEELGYREVGSE